MQNHQILHPRTVKSFVCRSNKLSPSLEQVWQRSWSRFGISYQPSDPVLDLDNLFDRKAEKIVEIGFGEGQALATLAKTAPHKNFIGIEVYRKGIARLLMAIEALALSNIRIIMGDAVDILTLGIADNSLDALYLFFADPWPKTRHHKRRLVQEAFVQTVASKLKQGGIFHLATDWEDYAHHMMSVISKNTQFSNTAGDLQFAHRGDRILTKYEQRGLRLKHQSFDLIFQKNCL
jgi:tRNA (guanine-N7-)-methyltransferase